MNLPSFDIGVYFSKIIEFIRDIFPDSIIFLKNVVGFIIGLSIPVSVTLLIGIVYSVEKLKSIRKKEELIYDIPSVKEVESKSDTQDKMMAMRWDKVINHVESPNENDWRQSIIEADIMLGDLLIKLGYKGMTIGEQLKRANKGDFKTLDDAWEAHKVRNEIAHAGSEYKITQIEAREVISKYRRVFEEFYHI